MNRKSFSICITVFTVLTLVLMSGGGAVAQTAGPQGAVGTSFTYQGQLKKGSTPVTGDCSMAFRLYDQASNGNQVGSPITPTVTISNSLFTVSLDFGASAFAGDARWLGIQVKCPGDTTYADLGRQPITAAPYSLYSTSTGALRGRTVADASPATNQVLKWNGSAWVPANDETSGGPGNSWSLTGNAGTNPLTNFLGTTDNVSLTLRVNNAVALRLVPNPTSPNLIGGYSGNSIPPGIMGAMIGGGGSITYSNRVLTHFGTIGGGQGNTVGGIEATVGGGFGNTASGQDATVSGGWGNVASNWHSTVGGGLANTAGGDKATIGGGHNNVANGFLATIGGGYSNTITSINATVGGGVVNLASGEAAVVAGGDNNTASGPWSFVGGGDYHLAIGDYSTVAGGDANRAIGNHSFIGGGFVNRAIGPYSVVGGGECIRATGYAATVAGGSYITATGDYATVGGGWSNVVSGTLATIPGGTDNVAQGDFSFAAGQMAWVGPDAHGSFVWSDSNPYITRSWNPNEFVARATGGFWFISGIDGSGNIASGMRLPGGSSAWSPLSDRNAKTNFSSVDGRDVLARLAAIPIQTWSYKAQDPSIRHIGPVAQDFYSAFSVGEDDKFISTVDADGIALASIQGLYEIVQDKDKEISNLKSQMSKQQAEMDELKARLAALETRMNGGSAPSVFGGWNLLTLALAGLAAGFVVSRRGGGR